MLILLVGSKNAGTGVAVSASLSVCHSCSRLIVQSKLLALQRSPRMYVGLAASLGMHFPMKFTIPMILSMPVMSVVFAILVWRWSFRLFVGWKLVSQNHDLLSSKLAFVFVELSSIFLHLLQSAGQSLIGLLDCGSPLHNAINKLLPGRQLCVLSLCERFQR